LLAAVTGCAGRAPQPVAVVQPQDRYADCPAIFVEVQANNRKIQDLAGEQGGKVAQNVAAGVVGLLIWPPRSRRARRQRLLWDHGGDAGNYGGGAAPRISKNPLIASLEDTGSDRDHEVVELNAAIEEKDREIEQLRADLTCERITNRQLEAIPTGSSRLNRRGPFERRLACGLSGSPSLNLSGGRDTTGTPIESRFS
jgi:hypothetical protein